MILFFDTETTGLPKDWDAPITDTDNWPRIVQIAYLIYDDYKNKITEGNFIIKPIGFNIPIDSSNIHGITTEKALLEGHDLGEVLRQFANYIDDVDTVVAHNILFDEKIVMSEFFRLGLQNNLSKKRKICTMKSTIEYCKINGSYGYKWPKLEELYLKLFGEKLINSHNALIDIQATAKCFWKLESIGIIEIFNKKNDIDINKIIKLTKLGSQSIKKEDSNIVLPYYETDINVIVSLYEKFIENGEGDVVLQFLSRRFPFSFEMIKEYEDILSFKELSKNKNIIWTETLLNNFIDRWDWLEISKNIQLNFDLINKFENHLYIESEIFKYNSESPNVFVSNGISNNDNVEWDTKILDIYGEMLCWRDLCKSNKIVWTEIIIDRYIDYVDWYELSMNPSIEWNNYLIEKYVENINWQRFSLNISLFKNTHIIEKFEDKWDWASLSANNSINWTIELINHFKHKINWKTFTLHNKFISKAFPVFKNYIIISNNWNELFYNKNFEWDRELLNEVKHLIVGNNKKCLSTNISIKWSIEFIDEFDDFLDWQELSQNRYLPWSVYFINYYKSKWDYSKLVKNSSIQWYNWGANFNHLFYTNSKSFESTSITWSIQFIEKYLNYIVLKENHQLSNFLEKYLNSDLLSKIMNDISTQREINQISFSLSKKDRIQRFYINMYDELQFNYIELFEEDNSSTSIKYNLLFVSKKGKCYIFDPKKYSINIRNKNFLEQFYDLIQIDNDDEFIFWHYIDECDFDSSVLILTKNGVLKKIHLIKLLQTYNNNTAVISLSSMDEILTVKILNSESYLFLTSGEGSIFRLEEGSITSNYPSIVYFKVRSDYKISNMFIVNRCVNYISIFTTEGNVYFIKASEIPVINNCLNTFIIDKNNRIKNELSYCSDEQIICVSKFGLDLLLLTDKGMKIFVDFPKNIDFHRKFKLVNLKNNSKIFKIIIRYDNP